LVIFIPPIIIAYACGGFWIKINTYNEQPNVHFQYDVLVVLTTQSNGSYVTWSTLQNYNQLEMDNLRIPTLQTREDDFNGDGLFDQLDFQLSMPLYDSEQVTGVQLMLFFNYVLQSYSYFEMQSMIYASHSSGLAGAMLEIDGDLYLRQKWPLGNSGIDTRYNIPVVSNTSIYAQSFQLPNILRAYNARNVTTVLANTAPVWITGRGAGQPFVVRAIINYPVQYGILYYNGFWEMIKWGWVQYVSLLVLFWYVLDRIERFVFQHQIVSTIVHRPFHEKRI